MRHRYQLHGLKLIELMFINHINAQGQYKVYE